MERRNRLITLCLSVLILLFAVRYLAFPSRESKGQLHLKTASKTSFKAPKHNVWADLGKKEADEVYTFLQEEWAELNLTRTPRTALENFIVTVETLQPNKSEVLPYLFEEHVRPERWAKETRVEPLTYPFDSGRNAVPSLLADYVSSMEFALRLAENVSDITTELLGARVNRQNPYDPNALLAFARVTKLEDEAVIGWIQFFRAGMRSSGRTLLPQGIYVRVNASSHDVGEWTTDQWFYNGVLYSSVDQFRDAILGPEFLRTPPNVDGPWTDTEDFDAHPDGRELPPPVSIQPFGPRYKLDKTEKFISWFGFEFYLTSTQATGVSLFDVRFKGERVLYELSLQEALAHYAGDDPMAGGQEFLDCFFGMGTNAFELVPGYDCPAYADYLDTELHRGGKSETLRNNICVFEYTSDYLLSRHTAQYSVTASRNTYLTIRSVSTVGNYDYTIDYILYLDGTIEVKVRASGYIYGAFYANNPHKHEDEYGHRIHDALSSSMHDHVISFKADLDIAGSANDMVRMAVEPTTISYPWDQPFVKERNTMHLVEYPVESETGLNWPKNGGEFYVVYSSTGKNAWGERKGYRITSGTGMGNTPHLTILNSTTLGSSARWAEKDLWVLRRKDTEPRGADPLNYIDPRNPLIDFTKLADGESLAHHDGDATAESGYDGDLVIYFNVGSHHVPHSGDIPNTLMHTSASSVMFVPHNFLDRDPSRESVQGVRMQLKGKMSGGFPGFDPDVDEPDEELRSRGKDDRKKGGHKMHEGANYFGTPYTDELKVPLGALEPDLERAYHSREIRVSDLGMNGSAAGMWVTEP